jgi:hypothetical protein
MQLESLLMVGIIPAAFVILAGMLILHSNTENIIDRKFLFFLLIVGTVILLAIFVAGLSPTAQDNRFAWMVGPLASPTLVGVLAMILMRVKSLAGSSRREIVFMCLLVLSIVALIVGIWLQPFGFAQGILFCILVLAITWLVASRLEALAFILSLLAIAGLAVLNSSWLARSYQFQGLLGRLFGVALGVVPGIAVTLAAFFTYTGFQRFARPDETAQVEQSRTTWLSTVARLGLAVIMVAYMAFTIYWASIWDQTSDGLGGIFYMIEASVIAIGAGMLIALASTSWRRLAGAGFAVLVPLLMYTAFNQGWAWGIYKPMTEQRAADIQNALEHFRDRNGRYPSLLEELVPRDLLWIPEPIIFRGESWCYQGGPDFFRLGAIYRDFFGSPLTYKVYASTGSPPSQPSACENRLPELKNKYDPPPMSAMQANLPTAQPMPTSQVPIPRKTIQPLVKAISIETGGWSPDGRFFFFGLPEAAGSQNLISLSFLDEETGHLCSMGQKFPLEGDLRGHFTWLPDGRVLFLSTDRELILIKPCQSDFERISSRYSEKFIQIMVPDQNNDPSNNGRVLLKSDTGYWILDGNSLEASQVPGVSPNLNSTGGDSVAWSPDGDQLVIDNLNGTGKDAGRTLLIVNAAIGELVKKIPMPDLTSQGPLMIDWLSDHELLTNSKGKLLVIDFQPTPPKTTDVLKDFFSLDIAYPDDISSMASIPDPSGKSYHLAVRVNHPRNKSIYLYHSETGKVDVLNSDTNVLLFFPGGNWTEMRLLEEPYSDRDEFEMVWVDMPGKASQRLIVQGHQPRNYPTLYLNYLPEKSQMLFSSSQGISLVSLPEGKLLGFWDLADLKYHYQPYLIVSPTHRVAVVVADGDGLYYLQLDK